MKTKSIVLEIALVIILLTFGAVALGGETNLVPWGAVWKYDDTNTDLWTTAPNWNQLGFDDSGWPSGPAPIGYGDAFIVTTMTGNIITWYYSIYLAFQSIC